MSWRTVGSMLKKVLQFVGMTAPVAPLPDKAKRIIAAVDKAEGVIEGAVRDAVRDAKQP